MNLDRFLEAALKIVIIILAAIFVVYIAYIFWTAYHADAREYVGTTLTVAKRPLLPYGMF